MVFRVAMSEAFRAAPDAVRLWPVRDLVHALLMCEMLDDARREAEERAKAQGGRHA